MFDENMKVMDFLKIIKKSLIDFEPTPNIRIYNTYKFLASVLQFYSLKRNFNSTSKAIIRIPKQLDLKSPLPYYSNSNDENIILRVNMICEWLEEKLPYVDLSFLNKNLSSLKVEQETVERINFANGINEAKALATYNSLSNRILYSNEKHLSHEVLHTATTTVQKPFSYIGFSQKRINRSKRFAIGLTEGYNTLLDIRYFNCDPTCGYSVERGFANMIEAIVGREKMEKLFFTANLNGLIEELEQYDNRDSIISLIKDIDFVYRNTSLKVKLCSADCIFSCMVIRRVFSKLLRYYTVFLKNKILKGKIASSMDLRKNMLAFTCNISSIFTIGINNLPDIEFNVYDMDHVSDIIAELADGMVLVKRYGANTIRCSLID